MTRFPMDAPRERVIKAFEHLGFRLVREGNYISVNNDKIMVRPQSSSVMRRKNAHC